MLGDQKVKAFIPTTNPKEAKLFYQDKLGLKLLSEDNYALEFDGNGTLVRITTVETLTPHPFTVLGWNVRDISATIKSLKSKGIKFETFNGLDQDDLGVWQSPSGAKVAWFKDPDKNVLSLTEM